MLSLFAKPLPEIYLRSHAPYGVMPTTWNPFNRGPWEIVAENGIASHSFEGVNFGGPVNITISQSFTGRRTYPNGSHQVKSYPRFYFASGARQYLRLTLTMVYNEDRTVTRTDVLENVTRVRWFLDHNPKDTAGGLIIMSGVRA